MKTIKSILEESKKLKKEVSDAVLKRKEELYVELKKKRKEFEDRYGEDADKVMHSTAMNMAKKEMSEEELQRRTMKDFQDHTPKEDDAGAYHKLVTKSGKRIADKDELDEEEVELDEGKGKAKYTRKLMKNKSVIGYVRKQQEKNKKEVAKWGNDPKVLRTWASEPRFDPGTGWNKIVINALDLKKKLGKGDTLRTLRVAWYDEYEAVARKLGLDKFGPKLGLGEANLKTVEKDVKKILSKVKINNKVSKQGNKFVVTITPNDEKDAQKALKNHPLYVAGKLRVMTEEVELDEALSSSLIKKLKKQYEPLRDKRVSLDNLKKMGKMVEKFSKDELIQLVKADIPFISEAAHTELMNKHNMSVSQIKKMKNEKVRFEDLVKKAANNLSELNWLVDLEGIGKVVIDGSSKGEVLSSLRKKLKNVDDIGDIERMTDTDKKKYFKMKYATVGKKEKEPEDAEIKEALDKELVTELSMFILNDAQIYKSRILPVIKDMKRKVASGKFDKKLAIKAFSNAVNDGIKKYSKTFDVVKPSRQDKEQIANTLYDHYQTSIMEFTDKYKEIYDKLNEDNQERIDFMLDDDKEYDKVLEFVSQFQ